MITLHELLDYINHIHYSSVKLFPYQGHDNISYIIDNKFILKTPSSRKYIDQCIKEKQLLNPISIKNICKPIEIFNINGINCGLYKKIQGSSLDRCKLTNNKKIVVAKQLAITINKIHCLTLNLWDNNLINQYKPHQHNFFRGGELNHYAQDFHNYLHYVKEKSILSNKKVKKIHYLWKRALKSHQNGPVFIHGDISMGNIIYNHRKSTLNLIDFGCCGFSDKSCDLTMAFNYFSHYNREIFMKMINVNKNIWISCMGWCLWKILFLIYTNKNSSKIKHIKIINIILKEFSFF
jgi:serine/threonine protein kinase